MPAARRTSYPKLLNRDFSAETEASGAVTDAISETLAQLLVPEQKHSAFRLEPPRNNSRVVGQPECYPQTGFEEISTDLLEADLWLG
jgi:hypothetical protein